MAMNRREFIKSGGVMAASPMALNLKIGNSSQTFDPLNENGIHPIVKKDLPHIFIDSCMQIWPDAIYKNMHKHGATTFAVTAWNPFCNVEQALEGLMYWHAITRKNKNIRIVWQADDIRKTRKEKKASLLLVSQCGMFMGNSLHRLEAFYRLGLRMLIPAYSLANQLSGGCLDKTDSGLTALGDVFVQECNRIGLLLDCSHIARKASLDIMEKSADPVVFSHSNAKKLSDSPRNISDQQIKLCAAGGGIIGLTPWGPMTLKTGQKKRPTLDDFIDHVDHVAQLTGTINCIGIGTDLSIGTYPDHEQDIWGEPAYKDVTGPYNRYITGNIRSPLRMSKGFDNYSGVFNLIKKLKQRNYTDVQIGKILGENYLRVFKQVWK